MARPVLKKGMSGKKGTETGEAILLWRLFLGKSELKPASGTSSYDFGAATEKYTKEYQKSVGLPSTGIVDENTWATYDSRMSSAPPVVQATARAVETQGEANKAAAMAAAVTTPPKPAAAKPAAKPAVAAPAATAAVSTPVAAAKVQAQKAVATVRNAVDVVATKAKAAHAEMPMWQRILSVGLLGLGGLVGYKAIKKP